MAIGTNRLGNNGGRAYNFLSQPVEIDCLFTVDNSTASGVSGLAGSGVQNVYMYSSSPSSANPLSDATASAGVILVQLQNNYYRFAGLASSAIVPLTGSNVAINGSALTVGTPYVITGVGAGTKGAVTIAPVADSAGSLASTYFSLYDSYGNKYIIWFSVSGVGSAPSGVAGIPVQQSIVTGDTASTIGTALVITIQNLLAAQAGNTTAPAGVYSFTAAGTTTVTVTNTANAPFPGGPVEGAIPTGFTFAVTKDQTNAQNWRAVGLPKGVVPAVSASFIATATGYSSRGGSTGTVKAVTVAGISRIEVIGDPNKSLGPVPLGGSPNVGGWIMLQCLAPTSASVTTLIPAQPAAGSQIRLNFLVESKSVLISGE